MGPRRDTIKKRPPDTKIAQQSLPAWEPKINCTTTWPWILICGLLQVILGGILVNYLINYKAELKLPYHKACSDCSELFHAVNVNVTSRSEADECECSISFNVTERNQLEAPVYFYYEITNFFQNHRKYMADRDDKQLVGDVFAQGKAKAPDPDKCKKVKNHDPGKNRHYYPCGRLPNTMFTDSFNITHTGVERNGRIIRTPISLDRGKNAMWEDLLSNRFRNPEGVNSETYKTHPEFTKNFTKPHDWSESTWKEFWEEGGVQSSRFVNWMQPSPTTNVRKLYGIIDRPNQINCDGLCKGKYDVFIKYRFLPTGYEHGERFVVFSQTHFLGTKKRFLSWFLLGSGVTFTLIGVLFLVSDKVLKARVHPAKRKTRFNSDIMVQEVDGLGPAESGMTIASSQSDTDGHHWG